MKLSESKDMQANVYYRHLSVELSDKLSKDDWVHVMRQQVQKAPISLSKSKSKAKYESKSERKVKENCVQQAPIFWEEVQVKIEKPQFGFSRSWA